MSGASFLLTLRLGAHARVSGFVRELTYELLRKFPVPPPKITKRVRLDFPGGAGIIYCIGLQ